MNNDYCVHGVKADIEQYPIKTLWIVKDDIEREELLYKYK